MKNPQNPIDRKRENDTQNTMKTYKKPQPCHQSFTISFGGGGVWFLTSATTADTNFT
jgi:hypothetical protein